MNIIAIIEELGKTDPEVYERLDERRNAFKRFTRVGGKIAATALPFALGGFFKKAYAAPPATNKVLEVLNYALSLEHLEYQFYLVAASKTTLFPSTAAAGAFATIRDHEKAHVDFLSQAIRSLGGTPVTANAKGYDFTGGQGSNSGPFATVFTNYATMLAVAQTFEDTGVRAYKGRAKELVEGGDLLTAALNIHSVEARHASHIRQMRRAAGHSADVKPWITGNSSNIASTAVQNSYNGEDNVTQGGVNITTLPGASGNISVTAATEAFDEGLTPAQVTNIVTPFIIP
ncbi:ferritin-like domain-containing protein [Filimonas effusa]|uniref:Ferritin-like domain-containing protein n=2 Tax=Filimonas effusa TaxID=2508721 RepID=A0A4Q1D652_9BACT|nr:ferritin-like domain-containing protein [Filimonas effusa]